MKDNKEKIGKKKKSRIFTLFMILYICVWMSGILLADGWIWDKAQQYQDKYDMAEAGSKPKVFMDSFVKEIDAKKLTDWLKDDGEYNVSEYTVADEYEQYFEFVLDGKAIEYQETENKNNYLINADGNTVAQVSITSDNVYDEYGFTGWKVNDVEVMSYMGDTFSKTIVADKAYKVYVNGKELTDEYIVKEKHTLMGQYMTAITGDVYGTNIYMIEGFLVEPEIYAIDKNGEKQENTSEEIDMAEFVNTRYDSMDDATRLRVSDTLHMYFGHMNKLKTYEDMKSYLVADTDTYTLIAAAQKSLEWVTPVKNITFVEEVIDEYVEYGDTYFSCSVYLNVSKDYGYTTKNEYFDATVLFKKVNNQWYWDSFMFNE